jgi:dTDP-4-dehydrorhamnose reductase
MTILLLGADGQLGYELRSMIGSGPSGAKLVSYGRADLEVGDLDALRAAVTRAAPRVIINATAYNAVDKAESEPDAALRINRDAVAALGEEATRSRAALIHYSTDFVFDGKKGAPYTEDDPPNPLSAYARSKRAGEIALVEMDAPALILRTAWVYSLRRKSFVSVMLELARTRTELRVVDDQHGSPTWCKDLASATMGVLERLGRDPHAAAVEKRGVYHAAGGGHCSRYELACAAIELDPKRHEHRVERIVPVKASEFPAPAPRPMFAPLDCTKLLSQFGVALRPWREALAAALTSG